MSRIVIIDTAVDPHRLHCRSFTQYSVLNEPMEQEREISHGTACAMALDCCAKDYELINIQAVSNRMGKKPFGEIEHLRQALQWCKKLEPDIVSLSIVSSILSDSCFIFEITKDLSQRTAVVAALDNKNYVTIPASYPFVYGAQSDRANLLSPGEISYHEKDPFGANYYANCAFDHLKQNGWAPSNSLAAPVVAAHMNNLINCGVTIDQLQHRMRQLPIYQEEYGLRTVLSKRRREVPIVLVNVPDGYKLCRNSMDRLYEQYEVQSAGIAMCSGDYDVRIRKLYGSANVKNAVEFLQIGFKTDLIFVIVEESQKEKLNEQLEFDIEVYGNCCNAALICEAGKFQIPLHLLADVIYLILSGEKQEFLRQFWIGR